MSRPDSRELASALEPCLQTRLGPGTTIDHLERRVSPYSSSFVIEDLDVYLRDGSVLQLVFKDLSSDSMLDDARRAKPSFLSDPQREIETYSTVLDTDTIGAPRCYGSVVDEMTRRYWLFLERVDGLPLTQVGDWPTWERAARWLARMHAHLRAHQARWPRRAIRYDAGFYRRWPRRARLAVGREQSRTLEHVLASHQLILGLLLSLESCPIHGELYPSNVLVAEGEGDTRIRPIDWEMAAIGPPLMDLAALTAGSWTEDERLALARAYREAALEQNQTAPSEAQFLQELACCRLHLALQWLGWSTTWQPPREQAHDWLGEAMDAATTLGLT